MKSLSLAVRGSGTVCCWPAAGGRGRTRSLDLERAHRRRAADEDGRRSADGVQVTRAYIDRIAAVNARGPGLNAVRIVNPRALQDACAARPRARHRQAPRPAARRAGAGQGQPRRRRPADDRGQRRAAELGPGPRLRPSSRKLRAAGAVILGKTNLTEFANFMSDGHARTATARSAARCSTRTTSTSARAARAPAPAPRRPPASPRSRSARRPPARSSARPRSRASSACGPRSASSRRAGILPISATQDTAGPMTRTVADAAAELQAIAGKDPEDPATDTAPAAVPDYLAGLDADALAGKRIGVINNTNAQYVAAIAAVQALGATTVQITAPTLGRAVRRPHRRVQARPQRLPRPAARERADEVARGHHRLQHRARRRGAEVRPGPAHREPGDRPRATRRRTPPTRPRATRSAPPPAPRSTPR